MTTSRPSSGIARELDAEANPSLCANAAPTFVRRFPVLPLASYSSTINTFR